MKIIVFANSFYNLGGGEKIFVEFAKRWQSAGEDVEVITNERGKKFCLQHKLQKRSITVWPSSWSDKWGIFFSSLYKSFFPLFRSLFVSASEIDVVFSASFIWPDLLPGLVLKLKNPRIRWVVGSYIFVMPPWKKHYSGNPVRSLALYLVQSVAMFFITYVADGVFTASPKDIARFTAKGRKGMQAIAVRGGVEYAFFRAVPEQELRYDAVFVGRFHPQKNVDELIDIWKLVVAKSPKRILAIVGEGYLEEVLKKKVKDEGLEKNVKFLGFADGIKKTKILKSSKIFLSASRFDTGNIALDEALASGLPGIVYNLPHLVYPAGVKKISVGNTTVFATAIQKLLEDKKYYRKLSRDATQFASTLDWQITANKALLFISSLQTTRFSWVMRLKMIQ